jgi:hypothetical protein
MAAGPYRLGPGNWSLVTGAPKKTDQSTTLYIREPGFLWQGQEEKTTFFPRRVGMAVGGGRVPLRWPATRWRGANHPPPAPLVNMREDQEVRSPRRQEVRSPRRQGVRSPRRPGSAVSEKTRKCGLQEDQEVRSPRRPGSAVSEKTRKCGLREDQEVLTKAARRIGAHCEAARLCLDAKALTKRLSLPTDKRLNSVC